ncbi:AAA-like domain-containing protein [Nostoc sp. C117]|uniref:AAA-like domain-containing protein n=1 Tax=Nostoc sp. C117 TaxID=3349875 RepID=UPI00370D28B8
MAEFLRDIAAKYRFEDIRRDVFVTRFHPQNKRRRNQVLAEEVYRNGEVVDRGQSFQYQLSEICRTLQDNGCPIISTTRGQRPEGQRSPWEQAFDWLWEEKYHNWLSERRMIIPEVRRVLEERECYQALLQPGALVRIQAPENMGKTRLLKKVIEQITEQGYRHLIFDFKLLEYSVFSDISKFSQCFCAGVAHKLDLSNQLDEYWDDYLACNLNSTMYFQNYLLTQDTNPLVLMLKNVDKVFEHPEIAADFCGLLRGWHDQARSGDRSSEIWQRLRIVISHSTDLYSCLNIRSSPLSNVGVFIELHDFTLEQVQDLAQQCGLTWDANQVRQLMDMVAGRPKLIDDALKNIAQGKITLEEFVQTVATERGIYSHYLRDLLGRVQRNQDLVSALREVVISSKPIQLEPIQASKLYSMGLVKRESNFYVIPSCELYRQYFSHVLNLYACIN